MPRFVEGEVLSLPNAMTAIKAMKGMKLMKAMKAVKAMQTNKFGATRAEFNRAARDLGWDPAEVRQYLATAAVDAMIELRANESREKPMETNKSGAMTAAGAYAAVAENMGLNPKDVKAAVEGLLVFAAGQMKLYGFWKLDKYFVLKVKPSKGRLAERIAWKTVKTIPLNKFKNMVCN